MSKTIEILFITDTQREHMKETTKVLTKTFIARKMYPDSKNCQAAFNSVMGGSDFTGEITTEAAERFNAAVKELKPIIQQQIAERQNILSKLG